MFDNHTFAEVPLVDRDGILARVKELLDRKGGASFFVRDESDATLRNLDWHSHDDMSGADEWADKVMQEQSFRKLMVG